MLSQSAMLARIEAHALAGDVDIDYFSPVLFKNAALPTTGLSDSVTIDGDAAFVLYCVNGAIEQPAGTFIQFPDILVDVRNAGSGRYFSQSPMHWQTFVGNAQYPFYLPEPKLIAPNSTFTIVLTNNSGGQYAEANMTLVGVKLFMRGGFTLADLSVPVDFAYSR